MPTGHWMANPARGAKLLRENMLERGVPQVCLVCGRLRTRRSEETNCAIVPGAYDARRWGSQSASKRCDLRRKENRHVHSDC